MQTLRAAILALSTVIGSVGQMPDLLLQMQPWNLWDASTFTIFADA